MARRVKAKDLRRRTAVRPERKTVVVFCEGEASEPDYIKGLKRLPGVHGNASINIEIATECGVPLTLVKLATARLADDEVDECWCVFDVEWPKNHPNLKRAVADAEAQGVHVVASNPCFELWLILHFADQTAFMNTAEAERLSRQLDGRAGKRIDASVYMPLRRIAAWRAAQLAQRHEQDGTHFPQDNPSSSMHDFLASIEPAE